MEALTKSDIFGWDVTTWSNALNLWLPILQSKSHGKGLELGGSNGGLSLLLAQYHMDVICSDLDLERTRPAQKAHQLKGASKYINYQSIDACAIPFENTFDVIIFKSILGGIKRDQTDYKAVHKGILKQVYKALKPGGHLLFAENLTGSRAHQYFRKTFRKWGATWRYLQINDLDDYFEGFTDLEYATCGYLSAFGPNEPFKSVLGQIDNKTFNKFQNSQLHYVVFGYAKK